MSRVLLTDVAEHQNRPDFGRLKRQDNIVGAAAKMSEGWGYVDPDGVHNLRHIVANDLVPLAYHFFWHGPAGKNGAHQAEFLVRQIRKATNPMRVIPVIDVELSSSMSHHNRPRFYDVRRFCRRMEDLLPGKRVCIYSGYYWRENMGNPKIADLGLKRRPIIWDANYFNNTTVESASQARRGIPTHSWDTKAFGGVGADILQFSDKVRFSEYVGDADLANTDKAGLRKWAGVVR